MIEVYWSDEQKTMIRLDYYPPVESWAEYHAAVDRCCDMARSVSYPVVIIHNPGHTTMPAGNALEEIRMAVKKTPANVEAMFMIIHNRIARRIVRSAMYIVGLAESYHIVQSLEEVEAVLSDT